MKAQIGLFVGVLLAGFAVHAQQPNTAGVPSNAIAFYDLTTGNCPSGWTELTAARGYYLTAMVATGTRGTPVGSSALTNQEDRHHTHTITHSHTYSFLSSGPTGSMPKRPLAVVTVSTNVHQHSISGTTSGSSAASTGNESAVILPHLQYLVCKRS